MKNLVEVYCLADNFVKVFERIEGKNQIGRKSMLSKADYITVAIMKQQLGITTNKQLYEMVSHYMHVDFPPIPSYQQFNEGIKSICGYLMMITHILTAINKGKGNKKHIVDSTPVPVCNNNHRFSAKLFKGLARSGKNLNGWYWGFKLHLIISLDMEIESLVISGASTKDTTVLTGGFIEGIKGIMVGDKGYIGQKKAHELHQKGICMVTKPRKNMKKVPSTPDQCFMLAHRQKIESVFSALKHRLQLINRNARSIQGFFVNVFAAIIAYSVDLRPSTAEFYALASEALAIS